MKIATYNMLNGGSPGHWSQLLKVTAADLIFAQESNDPSELLATNLGGPTQRAAAWARLPARERPRWGSAVFSTSASIEPILVPNFEGWVVGGRLSLGATEILAFSVHLPGRKKSEYPGTPSQPRGATAYVRAGNQLVDELGRIAQGAPLILGGDWNLTVGRHRSTDKTNDRGEVELLERLKSELGVVSAWPAFNSGAALAQTLRWKGDALASFHCDGIFLPEIWVPRIRRAEVLVGPEWIKLSDHNPVVVDLDEAAFV